MYNYGFLSLHPRPSHSAPQSCPTSLYFELVVRAAESSAEDGSLGAMPHIQDLSITSPLELSPTGGLFLPVSKDKMGDRRWRFSLFSRVEVHRMRQPILLPMRAETLRCLPLTMLGPQASSNPSSDELGLSRCAQIVDFSDAIGLGGKMICKTFGRVVDYATYYRRGVKRIFAKDQEVVGRVSVPSDQPLNLAHGCCNPIAIDNFLQVAGIPVNCLSDCKDDEVFVCTASMDLSLTEQFSRHQADIHGSWIQKSSRHQKGA